MRIRVALATLLAALSLGVLTACPSPLEQLVAKLKASLSAGSNSSDLIDCAILIGMPTQPTLQHPASNTGMYKVEDSRYSWEVWSQVCAGHIRAWKIETGDEGDPTSSFVLEALLWPYSEISRWGTWTTFDPRFMHPNINMTLWRNTRVHATPLGF